MAHAPETKAAVMAALLAGQGVMEVAKQYNLPKQTVSDWSAELDRSGQTRTKKEDRFGALLENYLEETLKTLAFQTQHFRDPEWLKKQDASSLAVLHGVQTDKAIRLLEAAERANAEDVDLS